jgi:hypothetical protein
MFVETAEPGAVPYEKARYPVEKLLDLVMHIDRKGVEI